MVFLKNALVVKAHIGTDYVPRYKQLVGFRINRKSAKLEAMKEPINHRYTMEQYVEAMRLRRLGYEYKQIETVVGVNHCTIAVWWFYRGKGRLPQLERESINHSANDKELAAIS